LEDLGIDERIILKQILKNIMGWLALESYGLGGEPSELDNELSVIINCGEFID
jgi:hypothetical protein